MKTAIEPVACSRRRFVLAFRRTAKRSRRSAAAASRGRSEGDRERGLAKSDPSSRESRRAASFAPRDFPRDAELSRSRRRGRAGSRTDRRELIINFEGKSRHNIHTHTHTHMPHPSCDNFDRCKRAHDRNIPSIRVERAK